jgi:hypothetical protein
MTMGSWCNKAVTLDGRVDIKSSPETASLARIALRSLVSPSALIYPPQLTISWLSTILFQPLPTTFYLAYLL